MRIPSSLCTALIAAAMLPVPLHAADLLSAYRDALTQDAQYNSARAAYQAGLEKLPQGLAGLLPTAMLTANTNWTERDITYRGAFAIPGGTAKFNSNAWVVSLNQPLFRLQNFAVYEQGKLLAAQAELQFNAAAQDLIVRLAQAYFDVLLAQDNVALVQAQKAAIAEQLAQAKRNFEVGVATIIDTNEAQARFDLAVSQEIAALSDLEVKQEALRVITGKPEEGLKTVRDVLPLTPPQPADLSAWLDKTQDKNLQTAISLLSFEIASREVTRNIGGHLPTLDLVASYSDASAGSTSFGGPGNLITQRTIGLQLALPLYQGGGQQSRVREAYALKDKAAQDLEGAKRGAALATRQAFVGVTSGIAQVKALEQALVSSQSQLDSTRLGQEVGVRTEVDVLNAQQQLYTARRDLAQARYNFLISQLKLAAAVGELDENNLLQVNAALQ